MIINNELKRARIKLALFEQEGFSQTLIDFIYIYETKKGDMTKEQMVRELKKQYQKYIKENSKKNGKQGDLFN